MYNARYFFRASAFALLLSLLAGVLAFVCIEKPGIDARVVYKNRFEVKKMKQKRLDWLKRQKD